MLKVLGSTSVISVCRAIAHDMPLNLSALSVRMQNTVIGVHAKVHALSDRDWGDEHPSIYIRPTPEDVEECMDRR